MKLLVYAVFLASASPLLSSLLNLRLTFSTFDKILKTDKFCQSIGQTSYNLEGGLAWFFPVVQNGKLIGISCTLSVSSYRFSLGGFCKASCPWQRFQTCGSAEVMIALGQHPVACRQAQPLQNIPEESCRPRPSLSCWKCVYQQLKKKKKKSWDLTTSYPCSVYFFWMGL